MIKGKKICILALCSFFVFNANQGQAGWPKSDVGAPSKVAESISRFTEKVSEKFKNFERMVQEKLTGFADKELGPLKNKLVSKYNKTKDTIDDVKDKADDAKDKLDPLKDKVNEGKDYAESVKDKIGDAENLSGVDKEKAAELGKLQLEKEQIAKEYGDKINASNETYDSSIKLLDDNIAAYNKELTATGISEDKKLTLNDQLASLGGKKSTQVSEKAIAERELQEEKAAKIKEIDAKLTPLAKEIANSMVNKDYFGLMDKTKSLESFQKKVFLAEGEPATSEKVAKITKSRRAQAYEEVTNSVTVSVRVLTQLEDSNKTAKEFKEATEVAEYQNTSIPMDTNIKIEEIKALMRYLQIAVAESKLKTAISLAKIEDYNVSDEARDITKFNFDDYNHKIHCKTGGSI